MSIAGILINFNNFLCFSFEKQNCTPIVMVVCIADVSFPSFTTLADSQSKFSNE